jgi:hypothetical protein
MLANKRRNEEVIGFFFCDRHELTKRHSRYLPQTWVVPGPDCYEYQTAGGLVLKQQFHLYLLPKVEYVKQLIKQIYPTGSQVRAIPENLESETAQTEIGASDLIVVATDNHYSRQIAQELALTYSRPLLCLGTHIDIAPNGKPRMYCRITVPPLGGKWCLMCGNIINL